MTTETLDPKKPSETVRITFELRRVVDAVAGQPTLQITLQGGKPDPAIGSMLVGLPTVTGTKVKALVRAGLAGNTYTLRLTYGDGEQVLVEDVLLPVR